MSDFITFHGTCGEAKIVRPQDIRVIEDEVEWEGLHMCLITLRDGIQLNVKGKAVDILKQLEEHTEIKHELPKH